MHADKRAIRLDDDALSYAASGRLPSVGFRYARDKTPQRDH